MTTSAPSAPTPNPRRRPKAVIATISTSERKRAEAALRFVVIERDIYRERSQGGPSHLTDDQRAMLARAAAEIGFARAAKIGSLAKERTLRDWHRRLCAARERHPRRRRPLIPPEHARLIIDLATANRHGNDAWGRKRIAGELRKVGIDISPSSIRAILREHGLPPIPRRPDHGSAAAIAFHPDTVAIDFLGVSIGHADLGNAGTATAMVAIHLRTRRAALIGVCESPTREAVASMFAALTARSGFLAMTGAAVVRLDNDGKYTADICAMIDHAGYVSEHTPPGCPWRNGHVERLIRTLRNGILRKLICYDHRAVDVVLREYIDDHYNRERPHQAIGNRTIAEAPPPDTNLPIQRRQRFGGLVNHYERAVA